MNNGLKFFGTFQVSRASARDYHRRPCPEATESMGGGWTVDLPTEADFAAFLERYVDDGDTYGSFVLERACIPGVTWCIDIYDDHRE